MLRVCTATYQAEAVFTTKRVKPVLSVNHLGKEVLLARSIWVAAEVVGEWRRVRRSLSIVARRQLVPVHRVSPAWNSCRGQHVCPKVLLVGHVVKGHQLGVQEAGEAAAHCTHAGWHGILLELGHGARNVDLKLLRQRGQWCTQR